MTLQDFISVLQAQPFRAFRLRTARGEREVLYPLGAAITPQLKAAVVVGDSHVEIFDLAKSKRATCSVSQ